MKIIFTAHSSRNAYYSMEFCKYVFVKGNTPINLFNLYGYFLNGLVNKEKIFNANNEILKRCDELWVFGEITEGVRIEIEIAKKRKIPIKYFKLTRDNKGNIKFHKISERETEYSKIPDVNCP